MSASDQIAIGYITEGALDFQFQLSIDDAFAYDQANDGHLMWPVIRNQSGVDLSLGRNEVVSTFLDRTAAQWLLFIDTDMGFAPDAIARLRRSADATARPVVGGLCFSLKRAELTAEHGWHCNPHPTIYDWIERADDVGFATKYDYPRDSLVRCVGTGAAFLLIHRSVLVTLRDKFGPSWFDIITHPKGAKRFSEDMSFCLRLLAAEIPLHVDTSVKTCHRKTVDIDEWCYDTWPKLTPPLPDLVVTGSPYSRLDDVADGLRTLGVAVGMDETFTLQGYQRWPALKAGVGWATLAPLREGVGDASVIHLIEHPLDLVDPDLTPEQVAYIESECASRLGDLTSIERQVALWCLWHAAIDMLAPGCARTTYHEFPWKQAAKIAGVTTTKAERGKLPAYQPGRPIDWDVVPHGIVRAAAYNMALDYGLEYLPDTVCDVVIPVKDHLDVTQGIIEQLAAEDCVGTIYIYDNGSTGETAEYLAAQTDAVVIDAAGLNIHEMWNRGLVERDQSLPVAILNNDLRFSVDSIGRTLALMEHGGLSVACPNYDGRPGVGVEQVHGICAGKYDGTGGLAGFAMFLSADVAERYRFPEELEWWGGDNDICSWLESEGLPYGIALGAEVEHLDGGSVTFRELEDYDPTEDLRLMNERIEARHA